MRTTEAKEFSTLMTQVLAFYKQDASDFALSVWWEACKGAELEQIRKALNAHAVHPEKGQFPPKPADIVRELGGTFTDRALIAWGRVQRAVQIVGAYQTADFRDPVIHAVIRELGGWSAVCRVPNDELPFLQKRFCDFHRTYTTRGAPNDTPMQLQGESETTNLAIKSEPSEQAPRLATDRRIQ